jgi:nitrite reductase/ring-hydroxylating ferredoxin subunit
MGEIRRFPFDAYPKGWFQVAHSREVARGQVVGLHYFGRRLICYRGDSGNPVVLDAYCPHLGADIAVGGTVADDCIICPFHGWRFASAGSNVEIPYAVDARYTFFVHADPQTGEMTRMGLGFARDFCNQIEQDIPIWENKIYRDRPQLARGEGAITEFRAWARQSYEEAIL